MNIEDFRNYCIAKKGVTESFPFDEHTLVFKVMNKMFAVCGLERTPTQVNLKCDPERAITLREAYDGLIIPGWHMNKHHWNTVFIEDALPPKLVIELIDHSYDLIVQSLTKKVQAQLEAL
ncbi:MmcQ/YjbR family DNA-binding protein [Rasiella rasia]|uniref:MmcQ/YjbR family DNA-binding protein n=1 Tax=Rasiella rasia TaxID=2744027 RepID=A0A6G6GLJ9_9FLAO|nr:MmcQ/YjbR family DNA-binding protein [Rasiella rasia]QIE59455.1 MmcQ/YjbR family DNA-binding protein [Rasiella rasia]